jgi:hypothetical protein
MGRGVQGREAVQAARRAQGFPEGFGDILSSPQGDIALSVAVQPLEVTERLRQTRNQALARDLAMAENQLGSLMDQLSFGERNIQRVQAILGRTLDLDQAQMQSLLNGMHASARSALDFSIVAELIDSAVQGGAIDTANVASFQRKSAIARLQARAAAEKGLLANYPFKEGELKDDPQIYVVDISTIYHFQTDENNQVTAQLKSPDSARVIKGLQDRGRTIVFTSMTSGVGLTEMERLLNDIGLVVKPNLLIDVNTLAAKSGLADTKTFNTARKEKGETIEEELSQKIFESLIELVRDRVEMETGRKPDPRELALIGTDERIIQKRLADVVVAVISHQDNKITSFDEAMVLIQFANNFNKTGQEPPAAIMDALIKQLEGLGWSKDKILEEMKKAQTGVMTVPPHPTDAADYLQGVDEMEEVVVGQAA